MNIVCVLSFEVCRNENFLSGLQNIHGGRDQYRAL